MPNEKLKIPDDLVEMYEHGGTPEHEPKSPYAYICNLIERISRLEAENSALQWREIDAKNLPKVGDEILHADGSVLAVDDDGDTAEEWAMSVEDGWTHYRSINSPQPKETTDATE